MPSVTAHALLLHCRLSRWRGGVKPAAAGREPPLGSQTPEETESRKCPGKQLSLSESRARMEAIVDCAQASLEDVGVNLCRREIGMTEHHLDGAQIRPALEQMRRKRVSNHMRTEGAWKARATSI